MCIRDRNNASDKEPPNKDISLSGEQARELKLSVNNVSPRGVVDTSNHNSPHLSAPTKNITETVSPRNARCNPSDTFYIGSSSSSSNHHDHSIKSHLTASNPKSSPLREVSTVHATEGKIFNSSSTSSQQVPIQQPQVQRQNSLFNNFNFKDNSSEILNGSRKASNQTIDEIDLRRKNGNCSSTDISAVSYTHLTLPTILRV